MYSTVFFLILSINTIHSLTLKPIVFIPGLGGSCIYNNNKQLWSPNLFSLNNNLEQLKVNDMLEPKYPSFVLSLIPNKTHIDEIKIFKNNLGFLIKKKFGQTLIKHFENKKHPIYALPYDFRLIPNPEYIKKINLSIENYIENIFIQNSNKAVIICHSFGSILFNYFINNKSNKWINKYIDKIIYINPPFSGSVLALELILCNYINLFLKKIDVSFLKNFGSLICCLPNSKNILNINGVDIANIQSILPQETKHIYQKYCYEYLKIANKISNLNKIKIIISNGFPTPSKLYLEHTNNKYKVIKYEYIDGDGVILDSNKFNGNIYKIRGEHSQILDEKIILEKICEIIK